MFYHVYLDANGRISIPKQIREQALLKKGDALVINFANNEISLNTLDRKINEARSLVKQYCKGKNLVQDLLKMRREDAKKDKNGAI